ncbi:hypothetical protein BASA61_006198 [Batrachochytrium salamandrivorans]|nr:hypothetical protein BASA61_006198 [Batrachochytrium salamandrivorans]
MSYYMSVCVFISFYFSVCPLFSSGVACGPEIQPVAVGTAGVWGVGLSPPGFRGSSQKAWPCRALCCSCVPLSSHFPQLGKPHSWFTSAATASVFRIYIPFPQIASIATAACWCSDGPCARD